MQYLPGLVVTVVIALCAKGLSFIIPNIGAVTLAILLGILAGNFLPLGARFKKGIQLSEKRILSYAIMLMGLKLNLHTIFELGVTPAVLVVSTVCTTIGGALLIGRWLGYGHRFGVLMGVGNAVCGSSAIAAVAPVVKGEEDEIGISIGVVNLMGTIGIFLLPGVIYLLHLPEIKGAYLIGGILQAVGHVVAAGFSVSDDVGNIATLIKMVRVLLIGPVVLLFSFLSSSNGAVKGKKLHIPGFIIGFIVCMIIGTVFHADQLILPHLKVLSKYLLMVAMAGVGMKIKYADLIKQGPKALLYGSLIFCLQISVMVFILEVLI